MGGTGNLNGDCVLRFEDVTLSFEKTKALDRISFDVRAGETRVILGAAGSGKTMLLKTAIGLVPVDEGRIFLLGEEVTGQKEPNLFPLRARVGVLFQEGGLFDSLTIEDNVAYPLENTLAKQARPDAAHISERVLEALKFVELEETLEKFPGQLSGGMRRRVGIARAVVTEPPLVLYDSPTAGLDPITANTIMALVAKKRDSQNTASLIVTHRYQDGQLMANFRYNPHRGQLERRPDGRSTKTGTKTAQTSGSTPGSDARTVFMVLNEGRLAFEGSQSELEACTDSYVRKFVRR
ncbi:MAG TPA: ATP-binding cassette domain-containing protein [Bryobacteraceae bacterium]|jgi:phospholipid/cholesterol/gamma-HCH transport system ATP-binding protein|nr:ATP-binding cassette domain-containing protein [Bryobacteraceae bacterium]